MYNLVPIPKDYKCPIFRKKCSWNSLCCHCNLMRKIQCKICERNINLRSWKNHAKVCKGIYVFEKLIKSKEINNQNIINVKLEEYKVVSPKTEEDD